MVMEYAEQGSLDHVLTSIAEQDVYVSNLVLLTVGVQVADAMMHLDLNKVIHRDLAARNILVFQFDSNDWKKVLVKVTDYGLALLADKGFSAEETVSTQSASAVGPIRWMWGVHQVFVVVLCADNRFGRPIVSLSRPNMQSAVCLIMLRLL